MSFIYPSFLWALGLLAIPIIIHLFNFRRYKTIYFSQVRFLKSIQEKTQNQAKIKHWLVLLSRLLALALLVLAFAQPFIPAENIKDHKDASSVVSIYLDNSFSMNLANEEGPLFQAAKKKVLEILEAYNASTRFQLITQDFDLTSQRLLPKNEIQLILDELQLSPHYRTTEDIVAFQQQMFQKQEGNKVVYWLSDFQKNAFSPDFDSTITYYLIPLSANQKENLYIDSAYFEKPLLFANEINRLFFKIGNASSDEVKNIRVSLSINKQVKAITEVNVPAKSVVTDTLDFSFQESGWKNIEVFINDFPIHFDDYYYLTIIPQEKIKILSVDAQNKSKYLEALFAEHPNYQLDQIRVENFSSLAENDYQLIILNNLEFISETVQNQLFDLVSKGTSLLIFPDSKINTENYNHFFESLGINTIQGHSSTKNEVSYLNTNSELLLDVFEQIPQNISLPETNFYYQFYQKIRSNEQIILGLKNNNSFLSQYQYKNGKIWICASPLDKDLSDFSLHALFVPLIYKMAISKPKSFKNAYTLGSDFQIEIKSDNIGQDKVYKVKNETAEWIPEQRYFSDKALLVLDEKMNRSGFFEVFTENSGGSPLEWIAINYNRKESVLDFISKEELKEIEKNKHNVQILDMHKMNISEALEQLEQGTPLWKWCIFFTLLFLSIEVLLLRFLR